MTSELVLLISAAASIAFIHTLMGPDHYLPFVAMGKARGWSLKKTGLITIGCGLGHSVGSILLGLFGIWAGSHLPDLEMIEGVRGDLAAWALMSFGVLYMVWGIRKARRGETHTHMHSHADGTVHHHHHDHSTGHAHVHEAPAGKVSVAPWTIFIIFVLGPCEPLIPLLMYPAAEMTAMDMTLIVGTFVGVTVATMTTVALLAHAGLSFVPVERMEKHIHTIAGGTLAFCGFAIVGLGL